MPKRKTPYRSKVKIGVDAAGKPINKWIQGRTRADLEQARKAVIAYYITGTALADDRLFGDYASEWYHVRKEPTASASTRESYRTALNKDLFPVCEDGIPDGKGLNLIRTENFRSDDLHSDGAFIGIIGNELDINRSGHQMVRIDINGHSGDCNRRCG